MENTPDEVFHHTPGMDVNGDEGSEGAAVQIGQVGPDQAGEGCQLSRTGQQVLSQCS